VIPVHTTTRSHVPSHAIGNNFIPCTNSVWFAWQQPATHVLLMQHLRLMQGSHPHAESISFLCATPETPLFRSTLLPFQTLHWADRAARIFKNWLATSIHFAATI
jgi:hypothetical protein